MTELGLVYQKLSKNITFNRQRKEKVRYNLSKNSLDVTEWFRNIQCKSRTTFIQFDMIEFYPSISKEL